MEFREAVRLALDTLWANRLRSFLTVLGNVVAVLSVVTVVSVIQGLDRYVSTEVLSTGSNVFTLTRIGMITDYETFLQALKRPEITLEHAHQLERRLTLAAAVVPTAASQRPVRYGNREAENAPIMGMGAGYPLIGRYPLVAGRDIGDLDVRGRAAVAVIGDRVREKLFENEDPIGREVRLGGHRLTVIGVLERKGGTALSSQDDAVLVPITTFLKSMAGRRSSIDIAVLAADPAEIEAARDEAVMQLKILRGLRPWGEANFDVLSDEQFYGIYEQLTRGIYGLLLGIVSLSLLIGGIVIMNIMLVSVTERTREIGIRKAVGARRRDIVSQFLAESVLLALAGGAIGVLGGIGAALIVRASTPLPASIQLWSVGVGLLLASTVGLFFGIYPAWRASRLVPVEALRHES